jgi:hypothetical protein
MSSACLCPLPDAKTDVAEPDISNFKVRVASFTDSLSFGHSATLDSFVSARTEDFEALSRITEYFSSSGARRRELRKILVNWFETSRSPERHINSLLRLIDDSVTESKLEAAIDLLTLLGSRVVQLAIEAAASSKPSTAMYVLARAAGRIESSLIWLFQFSPSNAFREAVIDLATDLPGEEGLPILQRLASDSNASIRRLAALAISEEHA